MDQAKAPQAVDRIMITLDSLLDTRLGVIAQKYPQRVEKLLTGRNYFDRLQDRLQWRLPGHGGAGRLRRDGVKGGDGEGEDGEDEDGEFHLWGRSYE